MIRYIATMCMAGFAFAGVLAARGDAPVTSVIWLALAVAGAVASLQAAIVFRSLRGERARLTRRLRSRAKATEKALEKAEDDAKIVEAALELTEAARRNTEETMGLRATFLAALSHDLRSPLSGVIGLCEVLKEGRLTADQSDIVEKMEESGETMLALIDDISDLSRIENGQLTLSAQPFAPAEALARVHAAYRLRAERKGLELLMETGSGLDATLTGDPARFRQIVSNLVSNAIKYTARGSVRVTAFARPAQGRQQVRVVVTDTGMGMTADKLHRYFQAPAPARLASYRAGGVRGLGLAITRNLCAMMDAKLEARSIPGQGSEMSLTLMLPFADTSGAFGGARAVAATEDLRVSLAGFPPEEVREIGPRIRGLSAIPVLAGNGQRLFALRRSGRIDALIVDLPGLSAEARQELGVFRSLEARAGLTRLPVACIERAGTPLDAALAAMADAVLAHPVRPTELATFIDRCADARAAGTAVARAGRRSA